MFANSQERWLVVDIGIIGTASEEILEQALEEAGERGLDGVIIQLDTPGGALENTRGMVKTMMASEITVAVYVGPAGSRAGSAGAFITIAGHVAAMAPGTNIGAAHPVQASGKDVEEGEIERKVMNDTLAFIESIAKERGRNIEMARSFVATSVSITADEAIEHNIADFIATDIDDMLEQMDGREITLKSGTKRTLQTQNAVIVTYEKSLRQKLLEIISNPNLFYLLFMAGMVGIGYELSNPGMFFPGVIGGICLILALMATSVLPVNWAGFALILLGIGLLVAEAFVPSFGILGIGGIAAFVFGSIFLFDPAKTGGLKIDPIVIGSTVLTVGGLFFFFGYLVVKSERAPITSGIEGMAGQHGNAIADFVDGSGQIRVSGSIWRATVDSSDIEIKSGETVEVHRVDGLTLHVRKPNEASGTPT